MQVAVTGAAGYVGVNLVRALVARGDSVVAIDRAGSHRAAQTLLASVDCPVDPVTWVDADVLDRGAMRSALAGSEIVHHLAAGITLKQRDDAIWRLNTEGVATVARAALDSGVRRMVHCSSVHAFDETRSGPILDETSVRAAAPDLPVYDRSKWAGEQRLQTVIADGLDAVICNPTGIYGPIDHGSRLSRLNAMVADGALGRAPASVAGGYDMVDVRDVVAGLIAAGERGRTGENYLLPGQVVSIHQLLIAAATVVGRTGPLLSVPLHVVRAILPVAEAISDALGSDVMTASAVDHLVAAPEVGLGKARTELGYVPRPFTETVRDLVAYLVSADVLRQRSLPGRTLQREISPF